MHSLVALFLSDSVMPAGGATMLDLDQAIIERHSTRMFLPGPVPRGLVDEALALAQHAPSNSNIQPWRLVFVNGTARNRLKDALFKVADHEATHIPALCKAFEQIGMSLERRFTARWVSRSRTRQDMPRR
jgi:nitroreductase